MNTLLDTAAPWLENITELSWKGALLTLAIGLALLLLRRHISPAWRHGLWLLVILRFTVPDIGISSVSLARMAEVPAQLSREFVKPPEITSPPAERVETHAVSEMEPSAEMAPSTAPADTPAQSIIRWDLTQKLTYFWLLGVLVVLNIMLFLHLRLLQKILRDSSDASPATFALFQEACRLSHVRWAPRLIITDAIKAPSLFGILRPAILLPRQVVLESDATSLKLILLHELAHLKRCDLWAQLVASLVVALHWFNPLIWIAARRLRTEAEMAADAHALRCTDAREAHRFGELLLSFANRAAAGWMLALTSATLLGICENKHDLRRRIEALVDIARGRRTRWLLGLAIFLSAVLVGLTQAPAQGEKKPRAKAAMITIEGTVTHHDTGKPIPGAMVGQVLGHAKNLTNIILPFFKPVPTDAFGKFSLEVLALNRTISTISIQSLMVDAPGMALSVTPIEAKEGTVTMNVTLKPDEGIRGTVLKSDGRPLPGAEVMLSTFSWYMRNLNKADSFSRRPYAGFLKGALTTDELGQFSDRTTLPDQDSASDQRLLVAYHPTEGIQSCPLKDWKSGMTLKLQPWQKLTGLVVDADDQPVKDKEVKLMESQRNDGVQGSLSNHTATMTDEAGRFTFPQLLPQPTSRSVSIENQYFYIHPWPTRDGKPTEMKLRLAAPKPELPAAQLREVSGHVRLPAGVKSYETADYVVRVNIAPIGHVGMNALRPPDSDGQFYSKPFPPGDYRLAIWVQSKKGRDSSTGGFSRLFTLVPDDGNHSLDLGEFQLEPADFVPAKPVTSNNKKVRSQLVDIVLPAAEVAQHQTWFGGGGNGPGAELALTGGSLSGSVACSTTDYFLLCATTANDTHHYSPALKATAEVEKAYTTPPRFTPGVTLEGRLRDVPADRRAGAWVVACVRVLGAVERDVTLRGSLPSLRWHVWTPLREDGTFRFPSLPRGSASLVAHGDGWFLQPKDTLSSEYYIDLTGPENTVKVVADTLPTFESQIRVLTPDDKPATGAKVRLSLGYASTLRRALSRYGHEHAPADAEAYARYKQQPIPGHTATTNAEGYAHLSNLPRESISCEVTWTDPTTKQSLTQTFTFKAGDAVSEFKLTD